MPGRRLPQVLAPLVVKPGVRLRRLVARRTAAHEAQRRRGTRPVVVVHTPTV